MKKSIAPDAGYTESVTTETETPAEPQERRPLVFHRFTVLDVEATIISGRPTVALCGRKTSGRVTLPGDTTGGSRPKSLCVTCEAIYLLIKSTR